MAREIDRKLRLTAALLGAVTCKDLAAMFRRANPSTAFDVDRAYKWLQGRARPRELQVYEDWAKVLGLGRSGVWIAECDTDTFVEEICARHGRNPGEVRRRAETAIVVASERGPEQAVTGSFACYSHAWSPYFRGRLIRGHLLIGMAPATRRLVATYTEALPTGRMEVEGPVTVGKRLLHLDLRERTGDSHLIFCLFPPSPPVSILGGLMCGGTIIGPDPQPAVSRIALVRLPLASRPHSGEGEAYLPANCSVSGDLVALGVPIADPAAVDQGMGAFLAGSGEGSDQVPSGAYRALLDLFDRAWLTSLANAAA